MNKNPMFCEKCNLLSHQDMCRACGNRKLREPMENDACFLVLTNWTNSRILETELEMANIKFAKMPVRRSYTKSALSREADEYKVFVKFKDYDKAQEIYQSILKI